VVDAGSTFGDFREGNPAGRLEDLSLGPPVPTAPKIVCVGLNYRDHAEESGQAIPESPILFAKFPNALVGHGAAIQIPPEVTEADYEAELGVVIGRITRRVPEARALEHVFGYTCVNDVSARDFQFADGQWVRGKSVDTFCPVGPWVVTTDEIPDPQSLAVRCLVNGSTVQDSSTKQMVFSVAELVSFISHSITLEPGDLIATGTPPGVGFARKPPLFLDDGDVVDVDIEGIGRLSNPVSRTTAEAPRG
jgi:2-keto-4-pentenoate hydratase/2-oxohepta-3-ene-1,7-dioic acid hydratase in catechol pathway